MSRPIEDYALIGDLETAALVHRDGSIDWLCLPRFDSPACFARLVGSEENGFWRIAPVGPSTSSRHYRDNTLVLETQFETDDGAVTVIDFMPPSNGKVQSSVTRLVRGDRGHVRMSMELSLRFDYGRTVPWVTRIEGGIMAVSGPNTASLRSPIELKGHDFRTQAEFTVGPGDVVPFVLTHRESTDEPYDPGDPVKLSEQTTRWWQAWTKKCSYDGPYQDAVLRSVVTLKAMTHLPSGGIVAAPTTSLPETLGGVRNWDYRFCWLRDATFSLYSLLISGLKEEAERWRDWLLRVAAGMPSQLQTLYGPTGERLLPEFELDWLSGYEASQPVRVGNQAHEQLQLDVFGEIMDTFHVSRRVGIKETPRSWELQKVLMDFLESNWREPDNGIWEIRGQRRHFTESKVMCWVAFDRAVKAVESSGYDGPVEHWKKMRAEIHKDICEKGYDADLNSFTQSYGSNNVDAALLMLPLVGFLPASDPRCKGTVKAIEDRLLRDGFVLRYLPDREVEGHEIHGDEGAFLPCSFWLVDNYAMQGEDAKARKLFEQLLEIRNDVGLLSEEYGVESKRLVGNFPQAFTHVSLVNTAHNLNQSRPAAHRSES